MTAGTCVLPIGDGDWTAYLADRLTGAELPLERSAWRGSAGRALSAVSEASIVLDPEYAVRLGRRPRLWANELRYRRDDRVAWTGPITVIDDDSTEGVIWEARDRMEFVISRRCFWRTGTYAGDTANLMTIALNAADYSDPTLLVRDVRRTGVTAEMPVVAGDLIGPALAALGVQWTVIGDVVRYGDCLIETGLELAADAWGDDRPSVLADGFQRLSHVCAVTENNGRVFYPSADPEDRPAGSPLLVDTIDVGDVSVGTARDLARLYWLRRQGELSVLADSNRPLPFDFPLQPDTLVPGAVLLSSSQGRQLTADRIPVVLSDTTFDLADGREITATGSLSHSTESDLGDPDIARLAALPGTEFPVLETYPLDQLDDTDWAALGLDPDGLFDPGSLSGPFPGIEPLQYRPRPDVAAPGSLDRAKPDVPPAVAAALADCCGIRIIGVGFQEYPDLRTSPLHFTYDDYGVPVQSSPGDLLIAHSIGQSGNTTIDIHHADEWEEHDNAVHDACRYIVASATAPASLDISWPDGGNESRNGHVVAVANSGGVEAYASKTSDVDGFAGSSDLPTITTTVDGCLILYGIMGMANELANPYTTLPVDGLELLAGGMWYSFCQLYYEWQTTAGETEQRTVDYPAGEFRIEWVMAIRPPTAE